MIFLLEGSTIGVGFGLGEGVGDGVGVGVGLGEGGVTSIGVGDGIGIGDGDGDGLEPAANLVSSPAAFVIKLPEGSLLNCQNITPVNHLN